MTETLGPEIAATDESRAAWYRILRKAGLVYLFSRLCVLSGAAIVAAELRADVNQVKGIPGAPFGDPHIIGRPLPTSASSDPKYPRSCQNPRPERAGFTLRSAIYKAPHRIVF